MFGLDKMFHKTPAKKPAITREQIAEMLKTSPEALDAFEKAYAAAPIDTHNDFVVNSRDAKKMQAPDLQSEDINKTISDIKSRIIDELLAKTFVWTWDGTDTKISAFDPDIIPVTKEEIIKLPEPLRPQLTGSMMVKQITDPSSEILMQYYAGYVDSNTPENIRKDAYFRFRQGLDILDYDPLMYAMIDTNPNSMGHWLPQIVEAAKNRTFFKIPKTKIMKVPMSVLQMTRLDYGSLTPTTMQIIDEFCFKAFDLDDSENYFIKTGTYSSKFDFRNAKVIAGKETHELGEYLLFIHQNANNMASPLSTPSVFGVSTTTEWVVREFIEPTDNDLCIYHGLPLHTEYRIFVDFDTDKIIGANPYWDPDTMKNRFNNSSDSNTPDNIHDGVVYMAHEETLMKRYNKNIDKVKAHIAEMLPDIELSGQWSIDIMQNGDDFYIIDMAIAENSALYQCVPLELRQKSKENWLPAIPSND